jgi:predicted extracellular nuclease
MQRLAVLLMSFYLSTACVNGQVQQEKKITIGFYNIENLFDTTDDPSIQDEEFLPGGNYDWTAERYQQKLNNMARVISAISPDLLGLCEIENRKVLEDLVRHPQLASKRYQIAHIDMDDLRGVDVALLYRPQVFKPFVIKKLKIKDPLEPDFLTRDILWVKGLFSADTLHVAVNHWPSRRGGKEDKRLIAGTVARKAVDSVLLVNPKSNVIFLGDFNDDPNNRSIKKILTEGKGTPSGQAMINTSESTFKKGYGTLAYNGTWNLFDQIIISSALNDGQGIDYEPDSFTIFAPKWMQETDGKYAGMPARTFRGNKFNPEGFSDHFPVFIYLRKF